MFSLRTIMSISYLEGYLAWKDVRQQHQKGKDRRRLILKSNVRDRKKNGPIPLLQDLIQPYPYPSSTSVENNPSRVTVIAGAPSPQPENTTYQRLVSEKGSRILEGLDPSRDTVRAQQQRILDGIALEHSVHDERDSGSREGLLNAHAPVMDQEVQTLRETVDMLRRQVQELQAALRGDGGEEEYDQEPPLYESNIGHEG